MLYGFVAGLFLIAYFGVLFDGLTKSGGSISHLLGPRYKPVVDDRTVVVGEELYRASLASFRQPWKFQHLAATFAVTDVLVLSTEELAVFLRQQPQLREISAVEGNSLFSRQ